jgi:hypothetical protein
MEGMIIRVKRWNVLLGSRRVKKDGGEDPNEGDGDN